jgi:hypothetical protein|tara:strand:+ start:25631 stop:26233 length:603 start_codon:yes stop_codon:yes gene_type:complete
MKDLLKQKWEAGLSYDQYITMLENLVEEGRTTGPNQSEAYAAHTKMAAQRTRKWNKIFKLKEDQLLTFGKFKSAKKNIGWLMIVEAWCGDVGQNLAPLKKIADASGIDLRLVLRDDNLDLMDNFLTKGGRSIPKLIAIDLDEFFSLWDWGPRPGVLQDWYLEKKKSSDFNYETVSEEMHLWYAKNRQSELVGEMISMLGL